MPVLETIASVTVTEAEETPLQATLFVYEKQENQTDEQIKTAIQKDFGIKIVNPSILEPDTYNQDYRHTLPEGCEFDPAVVASIRVWHDTDETEFLIVPREETDAKPFQFRVSRTNSNYNMIPTQLLKKQNTAQYACE